MYDSAVTTAIDDVTTTLNGVPAVEIKSELDRILRSRAFIQSHRIRRFLQFVVEESLLGQPHRLKEYLIGLEVFDRREAFDPRVDSIVRVEARRLRNKLEEYYRTEGQEDPVRILLRKGSYVPLFEYRHAGTTSAAPSQRRSVEILPFAVMQPAPGSEAIAEEIQRRLAHVLIKEGCFQVIAKSRPKSLYTHSTLLDRADLMSRRPRDDAYDLLSSPTSDTTAGSRVRCARKHLTITISELQEQLERNHTWRAITAQTNAE